MRKLLLQGLRRPPGRMAGQDGQSDCFLPTRRFGQHRVLGAPTQFTANGRVVREGPKHPCQQNQAIASSDRCIARPPATFSPQSKFASWSDKQNYLPHASANQKGRQLKSGEIYRKKIRLRWRA
ncbi:MAG TPA: hypothetical protein VKD72_05120, partial [Gemmataceae bacterium]|nr:hypothetical protein [Gemmataceae bacterium]